MDFKEFFKNKRITVMGLGLLGRGVGDIAFLARYAKRLIVTDLKTEKELLPSLKKLKKFKNITYHLGGHRFEDFNNTDLVIKAAGVPLDSPYIAEARRNNIPVEMSTSLFARFSPATIIGITGTRGKSTVTHLVYEILKTTKKKVYLGLNRSFERAVGRKTLQSKVFLGGNVKGVATLPLLLKIKKGDYIVLELDSWQLQGFGDSHIGPHISVFTTFMEDHLNYYKGDMTAYLSDKANIFLYQKKKDFLVLGKSVSSLIRKTYGKKIQSNIVSPTNIPLTWKTRLLGQHNKENISIAVAVADILKIPKTITKKTVENFKGVPGRMELVKIHRGIKIYNDTTATTPHATIAALCALSKKKNIILIMGGADKKIDMTQLLSEIPRHVESLVVLPGSGTDRISKQLKYLPVSIEWVNSLKQAVQKALRIAKKGSIVLLSPAFASFGLFKNEFDRGEQFDHLIKQL